MVNRVMEAKAHKLQRQLRKLPRRMPDTDEVPGVFHKHSSAEMPARLKAEGLVAPRQPNRELMQGYKHRAASLGREDKPGKFTGIPPARKEVECAIERIKAEFDVYLSFTILDTRVHRARVFFNPQKTAFVLLYEKYYDDFAVLRSLPHCDKKELVDSFRSKCLTLVKHVSSG